MAEYIVGTTAGLLAAAKSAVAGDVIKLSAGNYAGVSLLNINPRGTVTITSADPANPAVFSDMNVRYSSNLSFSDIVMQVRTTSANAYDFRVQDAAKIAFSNTVFNGTGMNPVVDTTGLHVTRSTGISVTGSEFKNLVHGVAFIDNTNVSVTGTSFHDIRSDGIRGGGNSHVDFSTNFFTNFHPRDGEHADAIQFWTTNTAVSESDIRVVGNVFLRGDTGSTIHGIFFRDALNLPFQNVTVTDNLVVGANFNGMTFEGVQSGTVTRNTIVAFQDMDSWLRTSNNETTLNIYGNSAFKYVTQYNELLDNTLNAAASDGGLAALRAWAQTNAIPGGFAGWSQLAAEAGLDWSGTTTAGSSTALEPVSDAKTLYGTTGDDTLLPASGVMDVYGRDGNDLLRGNGTAKLMGEGGADQYEVRSTGDVVVELAGQGRDTVLSWINYVLPAHVEDLVLQGAATSGTGNVLDNRISGGINADKLRGLGGNDVLWGFDGKDTLYGDAGNDVLNGGAGNDTLNGGTGNDTLNGDAGNDRLNGAAGADILTGGAGADLFVFDKNALGTAMDQIMDFQRGEDKIHLAAIDAIAASAFTNDVFRFIGTKAFSGTSGELHAVAYNGGMLVEGDTNGDAKADFSIMVHNMSGLSASDFTL